MSVTRLMLLSPQLHSRLTLVCPVSHPPKHVLPSCTQASPDVTIVFCRAAETACPFFAAAVVERLVGRRAEEKAVVGVESE
jgi:hypothetical protein